MDSIFLSIVVERLNEELLCVKVNRVKLLCGLIVMGGMLWMGCVV